MAKGKITVRFCCQGRVLKVQKQRPNASSGENQETNRGLDGENDEEKVPPAGAAVLAEEITFAA